MHSLTFRSELRIAPADFWAEQTFATVNHELGPWLYLTAPKAWRGYRLADWSARQAQSTRFKSWVLLLRAVPIDRHAFGSFAFDAGKGFDERSSSWMAATWRHERTLTPTGQGCIVEDRIGFEPRVPWMAPVLAAIYALVFQHRHRRLRRLYVQVPQ